MNGGTNIAFSISGSPSAQYLESFSLPYANGKTEPSTKLKCYGMQATYMHAHCVESSIANGCSSFTIFNAMRCRMHSSR